MKKLVRLTAFIILFSLLFITVGKVLVGKTYPVRKNLNSEISPYNLSMKNDGFEALEKNSLDVVFTGPSYIHCGVNPLVIWKAYGYTSYDFTSDQQDMSTTYYYIKDVFKTQSPKKMVVCITESKERQASESAHYSFDFMKMSLNKINAVFNRVPKGHELEYLAPYYDYHSRWEELNEEDFKYLTSDKEHTFNGYFAYCVETPWPQLENMNIQEIASLSDIQKESIDKIYALCKKNNCELMFVKTPTIKSNEETPLVNAVREYCSKWDDVKVIDYSFDERLHLDWGKDMSDDIHLNIYGASKLSTFLGADVLEGLEISEKSPELIQKYNDNTDMFLRYVQNFERFKTEDLVEFEQVMAADPNYIVIECGKNEPSESLQYKRFRSAEGNAWTYIKVFNGENVIYDNTGTESIETSIEFDGVRFDISSDLGGESKITKDYDEELSYNCRGLNVVVYDMYTHRVEDRRFYDLYRMEE